MCGVAGIFGESVDSERLRRMCDALEHRGPDDRAVYEDPSGTAGLAFTRLSIIDLSSAGRQPMVSPDGRYWLIFNGEIYNYLELRRELSGHSFQTRTDTEVLLAAYSRWGADCLDHLIGMFAFIVWDGLDRRVFAARDRFGVKPLYLSHDQDGSLLIASEIGALQRAGVGMEPDERTWATYLTYGITDHSEATFWRGISSLPRGHFLTHEGGATTVTPWYDPAERAGPAIDIRSSDETDDEYIELLEESILLRFRSDVPVGINLSGGLDSSTLLGLVQRVQGPDSDVSAYTFTTGDERYDELPWVESMLEQTRHPSVVCLLHPDEVPALAARVHDHQQEPFGGIPTLAYARLFERARRDGTIVLLDGQGMDEQWAGYDYYQRAGSAPIVQGSSSSPVRPECLDPEFRTLASQPEWPRPFGDPLRDLQYRDICFTKIPRALRFNDRVSMMSSVELREPFLDHRLVELALRQPAERKLSGKESKVTLRRLARRLVPGEVVEAPKRPLQTPQREWLRGPLRQWVRESVNHVLSSRAPWLVSDAVERELASFMDGRADNSYFVWQWISLALLQPEKEVVA